MPTRGIPGPEPKYTTPTWVGTGDIEPPERPEEPPQDLDVMPQTMPQFESWADFQERWSSQSRNKLETLAQAFANGEVRTPNQIKKIALDLGCLPEHVRRWKIDRTMAKRVAELLRVRAIHATAETLENQIERAKDDPQAWKTLAQVGEIIGTGVVNVQNNAFVDRRNGGDDEGDRQFFKNFQARTQRRLAVVESIKIKDEPAGSP